MNIKQMYLDKTAYNLKYKYGSTTTLTEITYHQTSNNATALNERNYLNNRKDNIYVSYHFVVDETQAIQCLPINVSGWHSGDGANGVGNAKSIGVEIARSTHADINIRNKAIENGAKLIAQLMKQHNIPMSKVKSHYDRSGKNCPHDIRGRYGEQKFRALIQAELNKLNKPATTTKPAPAPTIKKVNYKVVIKVSSLNIRQKADFNSKVIGVVRKNEVYTITEECNGLGHLKSGAGWISLNSQYVEKVNQTTKTNSFKVKVVNCSYLNARSEPNGKIVETVKKGTILTIVGEVDGWYRTKSGLFVSKVYCQRLD